MEMTVGASSNPVRAKAVMYFPWDLLPIDTCVNTSWSSPDVALLVSMVRLGESLHTCLNFSLSGLLVRMIYCIKWRFLFQSIFRLWWSINVDKLLEGIILNH